MPLQRRLTLSNGVVCPQAYGDVTDWDLRGAANIGQVTVTWWNDQAAHDAGLPPVQVDPVLTLTVAEQNAGRGLLIGVLYQIILARTEYTGTQAV